MRKFLGCLALAVIVGAFASPAQACTRYSSAAYDGGGGMTCWDTFLLCSNGRGQVTVGDVYTICEGITGPA